MPDLSTELVAWERPSHEPVLDVVATDRLIDRIALLHSLPWSESLAAAAERSDEPPPPWCPLPERLTLLTRRSATGYEADGNPVGEIFLAGWDGFDRLAPQAARDLLDRLGADPAPLVAALGRLPSVGLHGDLKLANVALLDGERVGFIDWQMTLQAPVAVDLGWFIVTNSAELPIPPDDVLERYRASIGWYAGRWGSGTKPHDFAGSRGRLGAAVRPRGHRRPAPAGLAEGPGCGGRRHARVGYPGRRRPGLVVCPRRRCGGAPPVAVDQAGAARSRRGKTTSAAMTATAMTAARTTKSDVSGSPARSALAST